MSSPLKQNTTTIQELLTKINNLPEASSGVELPELSNPATASELFANKELIDGDGNVVTGTFTIDSELSTQDDLIAQIQSALQNKGGSANVDTCTLIITPSSVMTNGDHIRVLVNTYRNGIFESAMHQINDDKAYIIENVICGCIIALNVPFVPLYALKNVSIHAAFDSQKTMFLAINASSNETAEINIYED